MTAVMTDVVYRPYAATDTEDIKRIINESFYIHRYVKGDRLLDSVLEIYLRERLLASTWARVAVRDGHVVGIIMGQVDGEHKLSGGPRNRIQMWAHMARAGLLGLRQWRSMRQFFAISDVYRELRARTSAPLTDELTLFAVAASTRGLGVGKRLYGDYLDHVRTRGRSDYFLYTDSLCTFEFYERQGMVRAASGDMTVYLDGQAETLDVYLYTGSI
ncbi:GNAT family N-acetyltransferase [Gordonia sp. CPCC 206044]|uniref:GNAT family N-acetyltransferase n=1 Tax=Gordonia sp. CPCC 206044 TaxID=3140793 RepID=UPI003AF36514